MAASDNAAAGPPSDALASIITQVSPNGQPARAPARPARPVKKKVKATTPKKGAASTSNAEPSSSTIAENEAGLPAPVSLPASTSTIPAAASAPVATTTAQTSTNPPASKPEASTSTPQTSQTKQQPARTKKKKSPWSSLLAAFGCSSRSQAKHFQDDSQTAPLTSTSTSQPKEMTQTTSESSRIPIGSTSAALSGTPAIAEDVDAGPSHEMVANNSRLGAHLPREETGDVMSGAVVPPGAEGTPNSTPRKKRSRLSADSASGASSEEMSEEEEDEEEEEEYLDEQDEEDRIIQNGGMGIPIGEDGLPRPLLSELSPHDKGRKCLVLDLDETLVHSSFKMIHSADYIVPVEIENQNHNVYVIKRPGVDEFLRRMGEIYEVVVFTASLSKYADPVLDQLDIHRVVRHRLFRESCYNHRGNYVKDLSQLGRPIGETIIIDNSPASYIFHPKNAVPVSSWFNDPHDTELTDMIGVLADLADVDDVRSVLDGVLDQ